jgi:hypothetical protein
MAATIQTILQRQIEAKIKDKDKHKHKFLEANEVFDGTYFLRDLQVLESLEKDEGVL